MENTLVDQIAPLNYHIFRGNPFRRVYEFPEDFALPTVFSTLARKSSATGDLLPDDQQPTVSLSGRLLTHEYANTENLPIHVYQEIQFDGVTLWSGEVLTDKETITRSQSESGTVLVITSPGVTVSVPYTTDYLALTARNEAIEARDEALQAKEDLYNNFNTIQTDITEKAEQVSDGIIHVDGVKDHLDSVQENIDVQQVDVNQKAQQVANDKATTLGYRNDAQTAVQQISSTLLSVILGWVYAQSFRVVSASRDSNSAITTASIVWPDGKTGALTTLIASTVFPGAIDSYSVTYVNGGTTTTYTQPAVTRSASGAVTAQPSIVIS